MVDLNFQNAILRDRSLYALPPIIEYLGIPPLYRFSSYFSLLPSEIYDLRFASFGSIIADLTKFMGGCVILDISLLALLFLAHQ